MNHVAVFSGEQLENLLLGKLKIDLRFFEKKSKLPENIHPGDVVYFRKPGGEILGQFEIGKLVKVEKPEIGDWDWIKKIGKESELSLTLGIFEERIDSKKTVLIIFVNKLEQFITPPIEIDKRSKKEWKVLQLVSKPPF